MRTLGSLLSVLRQGWVCIFSLLMLLNIDQFLMAAGYGIAPKFWSITIFAVTFALFLPGLKPGRVFAMPIVAWALAYLLLSTVWIAPAANISAAGDGLMRVVTTCLYVGAAALAYPHVRSDGPAWRITLWVALAGCVGSIVAEYFYPYAFTFAEAGMGIAGRAAGFYLNPNIAAQALVMLLACLMASERPWPSLVATMGSLVGLILTFSRAGLVAWLILVLVAGLRKRLPRHTLATIAIGAIAVVVAGSMVFDSLSVIISPANRNTLDRLSWLLGQGSLGDYSANEREWVLGYAWRQFLDAPVFGHGLGYMWVWDAMEGAHNMFMRFMVEYGLIGVLIFPAFVLASIRSSPSRSREWRWWSGGVVLLLSLFSHNMMEQGSFVFAWLAICMMASREDAIDARASRHGTRAGRDRHEQA